MQFCIWALNHVLIVLHVLKTFAKFRQSFIKISQKNAPGEIYTESVTGSGLLLWGRVEFFTRKQRRRKNEARVREDGEGAEAAEEGAGEPRQNVRL